MTHCNVLKLLPLTHRNVYLLTPQTKKDKEMVLTIGTTQEVEEANSGGHFDLMTPQIFCSS